MLTDRRGGFVASQIRDRLQAGTAARARMLERRVERLERTMAYRVRDFRGFRIEDAGIEAVPGADGWLAIYSDEYGEFSRTPNKLPHVIKYEVDVDAICDECGSGCTASITGITDHSSTSQTADACDATVQFTDGNGYICVLHEGAKNAQQWKFYWCAPEGEEPDRSPADWSYGDPVTWAVITVGDECSGECQSYVCPLWDYGPSP